MFNILKKTNVDVDTAIGRAFEAAPVSEEMLRRDNFFHNCWMLMKHRHPEMTVWMTEVELCISGYDTIDDIEKKEDIEDDNVL